MCSRVLLLRDNLTNIVHKLINMEQNSCIEAVLWTFSAFKAGFFLICLTVLNFLKKITLKITRPSHILKLV